MRDRSEPEAIELYPVVPTYCSKVEQVVVINGMAHVTFSVDQPGRTGVERIINLRIIMPVTASMEMNVRMLAAASDNPESHEALWAAQARGGRH